jgi:hypothetical protein
MHALDPLCSAAGTWRATYQLRDPANNLSSDSESRATVTPILGGRFVRIDYTWSDKGKPQEGSLLAGYEAITGIVTVAWIDSWHNSDRIMVCTGRVEPDGSLNVRGSYSAPPGPDWGWRTEIRATAARLQIVMFNVDPDSRETLAVTADYARLS